MTTEMARLNNESRDAFIMHVFGCFFSDQPFMPALRFPTGPVQICCIADLCELQGLGGNR